LNVTWRIIQHGHVDEDFLFHCSDLISERRFRVAYHEISYKSLVFSRYKCGPLGSCVYQGNTTDKEYIPWYATRERFINDLYQAIENLIRD